MAISNLKIVADKTSVKAGDTVNFTMTYNGSATYTDRAGKVWACEYVNVTTSKGYPNTTTKLVDNEYHNSNNVTTTVKWAYKIPLDWVGSKQLSHQVTFAYNNNGVMTTGVLYPSNAVTIGVKGVMNPVVTLDPSNPTIRPGETALFSVNVAGVAPPFDIIKYEWRYKTSPIGGDTPTLEIPWSAPGYEFVRCKVTIRKDGYDDTVAEGDTKLTTANGTLQNKINVMITGVPPDLTIYNTATIGSVVSGAPAGATTLYEWLVDGAKVGDSPDVTHKFIKAGKSNIQLVVTVVAQNYEAITVQSPVIEIPVAKLKLDQMFKFGYFLTDRQNVWGNGGKFETRFWPSWEIAPNEMVYAPIDVSKPYSILIGGAEVESDILNADSKSLHLVTTVVKPSWVKDSPDVLMATAKCTVLEQDFCEGGEISIDYPVMVYKVYGPKTDQYIDYAFAIDGKLNNTPLYLKSGMGEELTFNVKNHIDPRLLDARFVSRNPLYVADINSITGGTYELFDFQDNLVATADASGNITFSAPGEAKAIEGMIYHTLPEGTLFHSGDYKRGLKVYIDVTANPMSPMPTMSITQEPASVRLGEEVKFTRVFTDLPADADIGNTQWYIDDATVDTTPELIGPATVDMVDISNMTSIMPTANDAAIVSATMVPTILKKQWPSIVLNLMPNNTVIPWGQFLVSGYDVVGEEIMDDLPKLVEFKPTWYLDGVEIPTLAGDGSLSIRATHPGAHVIKASVLLTHPDYENGELTVEQSFNMTTEPRDMATTVSILPNNAVMKIGETQKFTATVTGAPVDATTSYTWYVNDEVVVGQAQNNIDFSPTAKGTFAIKVVATTKAQDAADDVQEATVNVTVNNKVMAPKAVTTGSPVNPKIGDSYLFACAVTDTPAGATITYKWDSGETTQSISGTATVAGAISRKCTVTVKAATYDDATVVSNTATVTVVKKTQTTTASASTATDVVKQDELYEAGVIVSGAPAGAAITYLWSTGETTENIVGTATTVGTIRLTCTVTVKHADYTDKVITTNEVVITVESKDTEIPAECPLVYVHPLPHRGSAYIWAGWWVMDAIEKLTWEGKDWKTATSADSPYYCHLNVLAKMLVDFPEVDVQESRNGRIIHRSALEVGIIY